MQSVSRLVWCTGPASEEKPEQAMLPKMYQPTATVDMNLFNKLKRKRLDSSPLESLANLDGAKRRRFSEAEYTGLSLPGIRQLNAPIEDGFLDSGICNVSHAPSCDSSVDVSSHAPSERHTTSKPDPANPAPTSPPSAKPNQTAITDDMTDLSAKANGSRLQEVIEHQFNLEILFKHRELRLIEQELAKCQVALEQLRRCEIIPYPGANGLSEALSAGTGPALKPQPGYTEPQAPAPWGVADGPYTRHYARWLLNDPSFDSMPFNHVYPGFENYAMQPEGRSTRNSGAGLAKPSKTRVTRDSVGNLSQALPNYPAQPRGKQGPLVIRRLADNQFVKLICNNCQRGDFSSVQGFLNHCRIAHKVDYKSHEAAALDCGRTLEEDEGHLIPQGAPTAAPGAPKPQAPKAVAAPVARPSVLGFVHPLNAQAIPRNTWKWQSAAARGSSSQPRTSSTKSHNKSTASPATSSFHATPLVSSSSAPRLSALFAKRGLGGDLQSATAQAREKIDLGPEPTEEEDASPAVENFQPSAGRPSATASKEGLQGQKGQRQPISRPRPAPILPRHVPSSSAEAPDSPNDVNLSPHTADSNPGLVSDHEDDDAASDLDEAHSVRHQSPASAVSGLGALRRGTCGEAMDVDIEVEDEADGHGVLIRPRSLGLQMRSSGSPSRPGAGRYTEAAK